MITEEAMPSIMQLGTRDSFGGGAAAAAAKLIREIKADLWLASA